MATRFHIPSLDGIRACAILIVFIAHTGFTEYFPGGYGVTAFFFLSGYLITTLLQRERESSGTVSIRNFYIRRTLRIIPPMLCVIALALVLTIVGFYNWPERSASWSSLLLFFSNYFSIAFDRSSLPGGTIPYWSLAVEEHYYIVFPFLFLVIRRVCSARLLGWLLVCCCVAALAWRLFLSHGAVGPLVPDTHKPLAGLGVSPERIYYATDTRFDNILWGSVMALLWNPALGAVWKRATWQLWFLAGVGLLVTLATFVYREPAFRQTWRYTLQGIALIPMFFTVIHLPSVVSVVLNSRVMVFLGKISYSFYLCHLVAIDLARRLCSGLVENPTTHWITSLPALTITIVVSWLMMVAIEKPCARLRSRFVYRQPDSLVSP